jgi:hypothetical protein
MVKLPCTIIYSNKIVFEKKIMLKVKIIFEIWWSFTWAEIQKTLELWECLEWGKVFL